VKFSPVKFSRKSSFPNCKSIISTSDFNSYKRSSIFPLDNQRTSVWNNKTECWVDSSEQRSLKRRELRVLLLMEFTTLIHISSTFLTSDGSVFAAKACRCITQ